MIYRYTGMKANGIYIIQGIHMIYMIYTYRYEGKQDIHYTLTS